MPYFVKLKEKDQTLYVDRLAQLYSFMFWMSIIAAVFIQLFGEQIVQFIHMAKNILVHLAGHYQ